MSHQSEMQLENLLLNQLTGFGYDYVKISDEDELWDNFKTQIEKFNNVVLTKKEFERLKNELSGLSPFKASEKLHDKILIDREHSNEKIYITLFDSDNDKRNIYQVSNQITMKKDYTNRYDVTILINGLPILQLELKRSGVKLKKAFHQINRYKLHSFKNLFSFIQLFVISNKVNTKYFANNKLFEEEIEHEFAHTFFWAKENNERITNLRDFAEEFLMPYKLHEFISKFIIRIQKDKKLLALRPYQVYAEKNVLKRAIETKNNGFVWHTTGSGKTLTCWVTAKELKKSKHIDRVFFLIDRRDLDTQTVEEFNKFAEEKDAIDITENTKSLVTQIKKDKKLIVTTIQKLNYAIKSKRYNKHIDKIKNERVVFLIDECHRTQFGDMHLRIKKLFENAQYFGFTGTPRFEENKSSDGRTTADIFETCLHSYTIKEAIRDRNVLGFSVEYFKTFDVLEKNIKNGDKKAIGIDKDKIFQSEDRMKEIAKKTLEIHNKKTNDRNFSALFTVTDIKTLNKYYNVFKELNHNLKISAIYSSVDNTEMSDSLTHNRNELETIISDYNEMFDTSYSTEELNSYHADVTRKLKNGDLDILLVVRMFLTGFDSKKLNTLYVDKNLQLHGLLQSYSRTNRVYKTNKSHGNIVCFRALKEKTDEAIMLFSQSDDTDNVLLEPFAVYFKKYNEAVEELKKHVSSPSDVDKLETEVDKKEFIERFNKVSKILATLKTFVDFEFNSEDLKLKDQEYQDFKSKYLDLYDDYQKNNSTKKENIIDEIDFEISLISKDEINVTYIMNLLNSLNKMTNKRQSKEITRIKKVLATATNEKLRKKTVLIHEFLDKEVPKITKEDNVVEKFEDFMEEKRLNQISDLSKEFLLSETLTLETIENFEYTRVLRKKEIEKEIKKNMKEQFTNNFKKLKKAKELVKLFEEKVKDLCIRFS